MESKINLLNKLSEKRIKYSSSLFRRWTLRCIMGLFMFVK